MPRHPTSFENYARYSEYRRRVTGGRAALTEEGSDLGADFFRPALPGPFNYTPEEFSNHFLQVDPLPRFSIGDDLTIPRNLLQLPEEGIYTSAGADLSAESAALAVGADTSEFGPEIAIPASLTAYLAYTHPDISRRVLKALISSQVPLGFHGAQAIEEYLQKKFQKHAAGQTPHQETYTDPQAINHGNTYR